MKKKWISLGFLLVGLVSSLHANHFYLGGGLGLSTVQTCESTSIPSEQHDLGGFGFTGGGFGGYLFCVPCSKLDCGLELFINGNTTRNVVKHLFNDARLHVSSRYNWGVRALPGYQFNQFIEGHFIVGYVRGHFSAKDGGVYGTLSETFNANGFQLGLGSTIYCVPCFSIRLDGIYSRYQSRDLDGISTTPSIANSYSFRPQSFDGTVSLIYNF